MSSPSAMYGIEAFNAMKADEAMAEFIKFLDGLDPEIRALVEARLRGRYYTESALANRSWDAIAARQSMQAQRMQPVRGNVLGLGSILGGL